MTDAIVAVWFMAESQGMKPVPRRRLARLPRILRPRLRSFSDYVSRPDYEKAKAILIGFYVEFRAGNIKNLPLKRRDFAPSYYSSPRS